MIKPLTGFTDDVAAFACQGHVSKADYETVLIPDVENRLRRHDKVRIYYEIDPEFTGFDPGAIWDDTRFGFRHFNRWERFAVVTDIDWIKQTMKFVGFLMPGDMRAFPISEAASAREWVGEKSD
ncbi:MAG: STAS/SEC14 domain-containing protein [Mycobacterium sp.]|nr:STAS/SEC14 domain-containing protein [Mycobacterium sp.]